MAQAFDSLSPSAAGGNDCPPFPPKPKPHDFHGKHELNWCDIEMEIHAIAKRVMAMELIGRGATDSVHGESLTDVFGFLADDISGDIERLKDLLGLGELRP